MPERARDGGLNLYPDSPRMTVYVSLFCVVN
jgi:hypothetical protein